MTKQEVYQPHASRCVVAKMEVANDDQRGRLARMGKAPERLASEALTYEVREAALGCDLHDHYKPIIPGVVKQLPTACPKNQNAREGRRTFS